MAKVLSVRLDEQLDAQLEAARELLERVLLDADDVSRGWRAGRREAIARVYDAIAEALSGLSREA